MSRSNAHGDSAPMKSRDHIGNPNQFGPNDPDKNIRRASLIRIHSDPLIRSMSYKYWVAQPTKDIVRSLMPGSGSEALRVSGDGRVFQGNTRILILGERGYDVNSLPREAHG
jgi:hypothetical protein